MQMADRKRVQTRDMLEMKLEKTNDPLPLRKNSGGMDGASPREAARRPARGYRRLVACDQRVRDARHLRHAPRIHTLE